MKKQDFKDRMHERAGMMHHDHGHIRHHLKAEHKRHGMRMNQENHMHESSAPYEHEVDKPHIPSKGRNEPMTNADDFKSDSMDTAYGQAGKHGVHADMKKIHEQFKSYGWDANTGY